MTSPLYALAVRIKEARPLPRDRTASAFRVSAVFDDEVRTTARGRGVVPSAAS